MDEVHSDFQNNNPPLFSSSIMMVSPTVVLDSLKKNHPVDSVFSIQLIEVLGNPVYQVRCISVLHKRDQIDKRRIYSNCQNKI